MENKKMDKPIVNVVKEKKSVAKKIEEESPIKKEEIEKKETKPKVKKEKIIKPKKSEAKVFQKGLPISHKQAIAICRNIRYKKISEAIDFLEQVKVKKKPVKMKGEIPHRKGKGITSGRYPVKAAGYFVKLLRQLGSNSKENGLEEVIISEAIANKDARPRKRFGGSKKKANVLLVSRAPKRKLKNLKKNE